ncbi:AsmA-like C-terminal region-containing protein [Botrimarina hoheduenensis]|uniref:Uncharacterized protein n=1 Tax=Botrimarina hoheduenensis TaxID=2528000 RepID=A0A5C5VTE0_9BACT|nr:AsmA-like C-terminal region-containing protein [Botrimarina hoheduenensis]TWT41590.1 hypothetical protein Pla111_29670 [Botrimarina hoheduenensis]
MVNACWLLFKAGIALLVVAALAVAAHFYFRVDDETRRIAEARLSDLCHPFQVAIGSAHYAPGGGVTLRDLSLMRAMPNGEVICSLRMAETRIEGRLDVASLVRGKAQIRKLVLKQPQLMLKRDLEGRWGIEGLRLPNAAGQPSPTVIIQDASVVVSDARLAIDPLTIEHLNATITPSPEIGPGWYGIEANSTGGIAKRLSLKGAVRPADGALRCQAEIQHLQMDERASKALATLTPAPRGSSFAGVASGSVTVAREPGQSLRWASEGKLVGGRFTSPLIDKPLENIELSFQADTAGLRISESAATWGKAKLQFAAHRVSWTRNAPGSFRARVVGLSVDPQPPAGLPDIAMRLWERFRPQGIAHIEAEGFFDGSQIAPRVTMTFENAAFEDAEKFPYRLTGGRGSVLVNGGVGAAQPAVVPHAGHLIAIDTTAVVEGAPVRLKMDFKGVGRPEEGIRPPMPPGTIEISGNAIPITPQLVAAIPDESAREVVRSLRPQGRIDVRWRANREDRLDAEVQTSVDVRLAGCAVNYERFPYELSNVTGWLRADGKRWTFTELASHDAEGRLIVSGEGGVEPGPEDSRLTIRLRGERVPLDERLRVALPHDARQAWEFLLPRGQFNFDALVTHNSREENPRVQLSMTPFERSVAVEPAFSGTGYRYRFEQLDGRFDWRDSRLTMVGVRAVHGRTAYGVDGNWDLEPSGAWRLALRRLRADRMAFNHDFLLAAPAGLRAVVAQLEPRGGVDLWDSSLDVYSPARGAAAQAQWRLALACHQVSLNVGVPLEAISGLVRLSGSSDGASASTLGELELDSLVWNDLQLSGIRGPLHCDAVECVVGEGVALKPGGGESRRVSAKAYGGDVTLNSLIQYGGRPRYGLQVDLAGIEVSRLSSEWLARTESISGKLDGRLEFQGVGSSIYGVEGRGQLNVRDANLYELPLLVRLLKVLRNRAPDETAFDRCEAQFTQQGKQIDFQKLNLLGDAVSFYGNGRANLDRQLDLQFHSIVGRNDLTAPALRSLLGQASQQLLQLHVAGTLDAPEIRREALPIVGNMIEQIQAGLARPTPIGSETGSPTITSPALSNTPRSAQRSSPTR